MLSADIGGQLLFLELGIRLMIYVRHASTLIMSLTRYSADVDSSLKWDASKRALISFAAITNCSLLRFWISHTEKLQTELAIRKRANILPSTDLGFNHTSDRQQPITFTEKWSSSSHPCRSSVQQNGDRGLIKTKQQHGLVRFLLFMSNHKKTVNVHAANLQRQQFTDTYIIIIIIHKLLYGWHSASQKRSQGKNFIALKASR